MPASGRIAKNATALTLSGVVCSCLLLGFVYLAANLLGRAAYGRLEYLIEFGLILAVLFDFGLEQTITRDLAGQRERAGELIWGFGLYRVVVGIALFAAFLLVVAFFFFITNRPIQWGVFLLGGLVAMVTFHLALVKAVLRSQDRLTTEAWMNLAEKIVTTGLGSLVVWLGYKLSPVLAAYLAGGIVAYGMGLWTVQKLFPERHIRFDRDVILKWQRIGIPIGLSGACILLLHREDTVMVNWIRGDAETGVYRAPYRFFEGLFLVPQMLAVSAYPVISRMYAEKKPFHGLVSDLLRYMVILILPIAAGGTIVANDLITTLLDPSEYPPVTTTIFQVLLWSLPPIYMNFLLGTLLNAAHRQRKNFHAAAWALGCNFLLNIPAIHWFGGLGAALVTILSQGLYCAFCLWWARDLLVIGRDRVWSGAVSALSALAMSAAILWTQLAWWFEIPLGAAVYLLGILLLRAITPEDMQRIRSLVRPS